MDYSGLNQYIEFAFLGVGGGLLLSGICWLIGLAYSLCINLIGKGEK